jgi:hypothetical protein
MATERLVIPGIVKNGVVVPQNNTPLPEARVLPSHAAFGCCSALLYVYS